MKKKIAILGSTGTIGTSTLAIVKKDISKFSIELLTANTNYKKLIAQAIKFKAKNILIYNEKFYPILKKRLTKNKIKIYCGDISLRKIISKKIDYTMCATTGIAGLKPTLDSIKISRVVAIANKESIICGWHLIEKLKKIYKTKIYPVDSEHFSIMQLTNGCENKDIQEIILTASGGPFLKSSIKSLKQKNSVIIPPCFIDENVEIENSVIGPHVSIGSNTMISNSIISNSIILDELGAIDARHILLVIDSCFSGLFAEKRLRLEDGLKSDQRELLEQKNQLKSRWVMTAGGDEPVYDATEGENSVFVKYFLNALESVTNPITAMQLFDARIKSSVGLNSNQVPTYTQIQNVDSRGGEFIFARSKN